MYDTSAYLHTRHLLSLLARRCSCALGSRRTAGGGGQRRLSQQKRSRSRLLENEVAGLQSDNESHPPSSATSLPGSALAALVCGCWLLNHRSCSACHSNCWRSPQTFKKPRPPGLLTSSFANCKPLQEKKGAGELPVFSQLRLMREGKKMKTCLRMTEQMNQQSKATRGS